MTKIYNIKNYILTYMQEQNTALQNYSLQADIATGWKPKMKIIGPMPLNFDNPSLDTLIKPIIYSETSIYEVVYIGLRPRDTFQMHAYLAKNYRYKFRHLLTTDYSHLKPFFRKFYSQFQPECKLPFHGMNPKLNSNIIFEGRFESGNLDYVVRSRSNQYDLFLRIDSNTNGHIMWYYFKVTNQLSKSRTVRLNICNLRRSKTFYDKCLQPYVYRNGVGWKQETNNLTVTQQKVRFFKEHFIFSNKDEQEQPNIYRKLSFDLHLQANQQVQIAYSIPYTYSQLLQDIKDLKNQARQNKQLQFDIDTTNISLSGLQIPYIKISQNRSKDVENTQKKQTILIIGRQHPGQSNGSHVLKGFLQQLIRSKDKNIQNLKAKFNFHIIPMVNPDGVVMGNFRTSLYGKDLNRLFKKNQTLMIPEIQFCKNLVFQITKKKKKKIFMFMDFHGHSVKRNAFCFAPSTFQTNSIEDVREFPKIIGEVTQMFRYPSCSFRISNHKKTTARAVFCNDANLFYTIQTSNWSYFSKQVKQNILFDEKLLVKLGNCLLVSLAIYYKKVAERKDARKKKILQQQKDLKHLLQHNSSSLFKIKQVKKIYLKTHENLLNEREKSVGMLNKNHIINISSQQTLLPGSIKILRKDNSFHKNSNMDLKVNSTSRDNQTKARKQGKKPINSSTDRRIKILQQSSDEALNLDEKQAKQKQINMQNEQKDQKNQSQGDIDDSDQSQKQDMEKQKFKKYINGATKMFIEFQKAYYGDEYQAKGRYQIPKKIAKRKERQIPIVLQACLKNKSKSDRNTIQTDKNINKAGYSQQKQTEGRVRFHKIDEIAKKPIMNLNQIQVSSKQEALKTLPKLNILNYIAYEDIGATIQKKIFKIPKIESVHIKNIRKY